MSDRPAIPEPLRRRVLVEARHRCAVCRDPSYDIAHIEPWANVRSHEFENLIALCPNCHRRHHRGEIDSGSLRMYKANLSVVSDRYSEFERRVLEFFASNPEAPGIRLQNADFQLLYLLKDGLLVDAGTGGISVRMGGTETAPKNYLLTESGRQFVRKWVAGESLGEP